MNTSSNIVFECDRLAADGVVTECQDQNQPAGPLHEDTRRDIKSILYQFSGIEEQELHTNPYYDQVNTDLLARLPV